MRPELIALGAELSKRGDPFVIATVVRREPPSSAQVGDGALITQAGTIHGWLGGSCTRPTVVNLARQAIRDGLPRLVAISADPDTNLRPGMIAMPMTCISGGAVDVYIEPILPAPRIVVYGVSPAAQALVRIGKVMGYSVEAVDPKADVTTFPEADFLIADMASEDFTRRVARHPAHLIAVVATLGVWDEEALEHAVSLAPSYLGLIASSKRFGEIKSILSTKGVSSVAIEQIRCPAGVNIGAVAPEEIALSVMAEIVQQFRTAPPVGLETPSPEAGLEDEDGTIDPVCGMTVDPRTSKHRANVSGQTYVFCCNACRERFVTDPNQFLSEPQGQNGG